MLTQVDAELKELKASGVVPDDMYQTYVDDITLWANDAYTIVGELEAGNDETAIELIFSNCVPELDTLVETALTLDDEIDAQVESSIKTCQKNILYMHHSLSYDHRCINRICRDDKQEHSEVNHSTIARD
jgi:hypothetical protein